MHFILIKSYWTYIFHISRYYLWFVCFMFGFTFKFFFGHNMYMSFGSTFVLVIFMHVTIWTNSRCYFYCYYYFILSFFLETISMLRHDCIHGKISYCSYAYMHQENQMLHESITHSQRNQALTSFGCVSTMQSWTNEPQISLLNKFDGTHSKFWDFVN